MTPSPIPVVITNQPGTDWWAQLLDGVVGAIVAAAVSAVVAWFIVSRQHKADVRTARLVAAYEAAASLADAAADAAQATAEALGRGIVCPKAEADMVVMHWLRAAVRHEPLLTRWMDVDVVVDFTDALETWSHAVTNVGTFIDEHRNIQPSPGEVSRVAAIAAEVPARLGPLGERLAEFRRTGVAPSR